MTRGSTHGATDRPDSGWSALREGRWADARAAFEQALASGATPKAFEGLSWACWWLDDAEGVLAAREHAYRLYRQGGDAASAGRMATWLAADQIDFRGAMAVANGWLARASRLLDPVEAGADHGWFAFHSGYVASLCGEPERAAELAMQAVRLGQERGVADLEMLGLALRGSTLVARGRVDEGMRCLDEATAMAIAGEATIPISCAWTCCFLVSACTMIRDFKRAYEWCDRIAEFSQRYGSRYMLAFCRAKYGEVHLWRGQWREAEQILQASVEDFERSRPVMIGAPLVTLAELRRRQGRHDEAGALLDRAGASSGAQLGRARAALDAGDPARAVGILDRLLRQLPAHRELDRVPGLELVVRARIASCEHQHAASALEELRGTQARVGTDLLRASVDRSAGLVAAATGDHESARRLLEDAVDRFEQTGAPYEAALARIELATSLRALDDGETATREIGLARARLLQLGAVSDADPPDPVGPGTAGDDPPSLRGVTPREREVLGLLAKGLTNRQIGDVLGVSEHTVHRHVTNILRKLDLPSRAAAAAHAVRARLVVAGEP